MVWSRAVRTINPNHFRSIYAPNTTYIWYAQYQTSLYCPKQTFPIRGSRYLAQVLRCAPKAPVVPSHSRSFHVGNRTILELPDHKSSRFRTIQTSSSVPAPRRVARLFTCPSIVAFTSCRNVDGYLPRLLAICVLFWTTRVITRLFRSQKPLLPS